MKRIFTLRFMLISLFAAMGMAMNAGIIYYTDNDFWYDLDTETKTAEVARYKGSATEVTIPESVTLYDVTFSVTSLGNSSFSRCESLTSIGIPSSVTRLGERCFISCSSLTSIVIPSSVTSLGNSCFSDCSSLTSIDIPSSVTSLGNHCFSDCSSLTSVTIPSSVTSLGSYCFEDCSALTSIDIPSSVTRLGDDCFYGCESLTSINIPSSVTRLGDDCFAQCFSLQTIICEIPTAIVGDFFNGTPIEQATLYVPESSLLSYQSTWSWSSFGTILPISQDGIGEIATEGDASIDAIYNLEGKRINGISCGLNIIRMSDGTTRKVLK